MKKGLTLLLTILAFSCFGHVNFIDFDQIKSKTDYSSLKKFLFDNVKYFDHWSQQWRYSVSKTDLVEKLQDCATAYSKCDTSSLEVNLLLGDISHFLYNLDVESSYEKAVNYYKNAIRINPKDYRPYWFLGTHYALSNVQVESVRYFFEAQAHLPSKENADFWNEYSFATLLANMPSHAIYALDRAKEILGHQSQFDDEMGYQIRHRLQPVRIDTTVRKHDLWEYSRGDLLSFSSRMLGFKFQVDSTWLLDLSDYKDHAAYIAITPPAIRNKKNVEIRYTIAVIAKVATSRDQFEKFIEPFIEKYKNKLIVPFQSPYPNLVSYEVKDEKMYKNMGGAHLNELALERVCPKYPGLLLENPNILQRTGSNQIQYFAMNDCKNRFKENIYYAVILDTCEDIYTEAYAVFTKFVNNQLVIE